VHGIEANDGGSRQPGAFLPSNGVMTLEKSPLKMALN
jgi:hypothetical protein